MSSNLESTRWFRMHTSPWRTMYTALASPLQLYKGPTAPIPLWRFSRAITPCCMTLIFWQINLIVCSLNVPIFTWFKAFCRCLDKHASISLMSFFVRFILDLVRAVNSLAMRRSNCMVPQRLFSYNEASEKPLYLSWDATLAALSIDASNFPQTLSFNKILREGLLTF